MTGWETFRRGHNMIFAGGCPRSGTTLLQRVIGAHPEVFSDQEFQILPSHLIGLRQALTGNIRSGNIDRIVDNETVDDALRNFVATIFYKKLTETGNRVFCEKTPSNALIIPELFELFPESRFILILRNPRDIVNSFKGVRQRYLSQSLRPPRFVRSVATSVEEVNRYFNESIKAARSDSRVLTIYYEDLVGTPEIMIRKICDHTGLSFTQEMLELDNCNSTVPAKKNELWYTKQALSAGIRKKGVVTQDDLLTEKEKRLVSLYSRSLPELERYNLQPRKPTVLERLYWKISEVEKHGIFLPRRRA